MAVTLAGLAPLDDDNGIGDTQHEAHSMLTQHHSPS